MPGIHDRGGWPDDTPIDPSEHVMAAWEEHTDALMRLLSAPAKGIIRVDELRRAIESLDPERYEAYSYYQRWLSAIEMLLVEKGILTIDEIDARAASIPNSES